MDKERFLASGLLEQYVLGLTSPEESQEVEQYANAFPEIQDEIDALQQAMAQYAKQHAVPPPDQLKSKILNEIDELAAKERSTPNRGSVKTPRVARWPFLLLLSLLFLMAMLAGNLFIQKNRIADQLEITSAAYSAYQLDCEAEKKRHQEMEAIYALVQHPATKTIHLKGATIAPNAIAVAYWNETAGKGYVNLLNLPTPPEGHQYQIWADIDEDMIDMGLLVAENGKIQAIEFGANATSLNITLEPLGGSKKPNVDQLYVNGPV